MNKAKYTWLWQIPQLIKEHPMETKVLKMRTNRNGHTDGSNTSFYLSNNINKEKALNLTPETDYACIMVPIPEGWRIATENDDGREGKFLSGSGHWCVAVNLQKSNLLSIVPDTPEVKLTIGGKEVNLPKSIIKEIQLYNTSGMCIYCHVFPETFDLS